MSTVNVNIFNRDNVKLLNEIETKKPVNKAELALIDILNAKKDKVKVLDYQAHDRSKNIVTQSKNAIYSGVNYEPAFCDNDILYIKDKDHLDIEESVIVSINTANRKADITAYINEILEIVFKQVYGEVYIIFPCSNLYGKELGEGLRIERLSNDEQFINNKYSHKAIKNLAKSFNLNCQIFENDNDDYALLSFNAIEKTEPKETKKSKK